MIVMLGLLALVYGQRMFWMFVGIAGFLAGWELIRILPVEQVPLFFMAGGIASGTIAALLAKYLEPIAIFVAGFLAGAYLALVISAFIGLMVPGLLWGAVGGFMGAVLVGMFKDWAVMILSSLVGAGAMTSQLGLDVGYMLLVFLGLTAIGIYTQVRCRD